MQSEIKDESDFATFCSSLRSRPIWRALGPILTSSSEMRLQESYLMTHDFAFPIPNNHSPRQLRVMLLTASLLDDAVQKETVSRLDEFSRFGDSVDLAIAFFLSEESFVSASKKYKLNRWMSLQEYLLEPLSVQIPIIPIAESSSFLSSMKEYINGLANAPRLGPSPASSVSLLPYLTTSMPYHLLSKHNTDILGELFPTLLALSRACRTETGHVLLGEYLGEKAAGRITGFWGGDRICE